MAINFFIKQVSDRFRATKCGYLEIEPAQLITEIFGGEEVVVSAEKPVSKISNKKISAVFVFNFFF